MNEMVLKLPPSRSDLRAHLPPSPTGWSTPPWRLLDVCCICEVLTYQDHTAGKRRPY